MPVSEFLKKRFWWLPFGRVPEISADDLYASLQDEASPQMLDMRTAAEWRLSHIQGAHNLTLKQLKREMDSLDLDAQRPIVAICLSAHRSIPAVRLLRARGFGNAVQLEGGMLAWWKRKLPTADGD